MNEVKQLCERALDGPEPPLPDAADVLAMARRATRTRDLRRAVCGLAAVTALAAGTALVAPQVIAADPPRPAPLETAASSPPPPLAGAPPAPTMEQAAEHVPQIVDLLADALPDGYSVVPHDDPSTWYAQLADDSYVVITVVSVLSGTGAGAVQIIIRGDTPGGGDMCEPEISAGFAAPAGAHCRMAVGDGGPVWTIAGRDAARGEVRAATRILDGGYLTVVAQQAIESRDSPPLDRAPFTDVELATLVADPAIVP